MLKDDREYYFACALANLRFRGAVRKHLDELEWHSHLSARLVEFFTQPSMEGLAHHPLTLKAYLLHDFTEPEINDVLNECLQHLALGAEESSQHTEELLRSFQRFYQTQKITDLLREHSNTGNSDKTEKLIDGVVELQNMKFSTIPTYVLGNLDVDIVQKEDYGNNQYIPSYFLPWFFDDPSDQLREMKWNYMSGDLVMVCAAPGTGKTNFLAHEIVYMLRQNQARKESGQDPLKIYWIALGDMRRLDFINRFSAIYHNINFDTVKVSPKTYFNNDALRDVMQDIIISPVPASYVDIHRLKYFIETNLADQDFDPNVVIIDYDANLQSNRTENLYAAGEEVYNIASGLANPIGGKKRLVFIASQPKIEFWSQCPIPKEGAAESSRKQAIIDLMITLGKNKKSEKGRHVGEMFIAKNRRGDEGITAHFEIKKGLISPLTPEEYASALVFTSEKKYNSRR